MLIVLYNETPEMAFFGQGPNFLLKEGLVHSKSHGKVLLRAMASGVLEWRDPKTKSVMNFMNMNDVCANPSLGS